MHLVFALAACNVQPALAGPTTHPAPAWKVQAHMDHHFDMASDALFAVMDGDVEAAKAKGAELATHKPLADVPESWMIQLVEMQSASKELAKSTDLADASHDVVALGATCRACHAASKGPVMDAKNLAKISLGEGAMARHQWGTFLLWLGYMGANEDVWKLGTDTIGHADGSLPPLPEGVKALEEKAHRLAGNAGKATTTAEKAAVLSDLLTTCATCHSQIGVKVR
ncbi:MAG: hypothetical protein H6736_20640 [Alphaproteobacteria bacterium]|nr:hypothetical protein [Alphaproteobacteria bacterium]